jgi:hypothetical protein
VSREKRENERKEYEKSVRCPPPSVLAATRLRAADPSQMRAPRAWEGFVPVRISYGALVVAMAEPEDDATIDEMKRLTNQEVKPVRASAGEIERAIARCYDAQN